MIATISQHNTVFSKNKATCQGYTLEKYFRCAISAQVKIRVQYRRYRMLEKYNFKFIKL